MLIKEVTDTSVPKLAALVQVLSGRAANTGAKKEISVPAFLNMAQTLGYSISKDNLNMMLSEPPLSNLFEPMDPNSGMLQFKGAPTPDVGMPVDTARDIVAKNAKAAMKRD